MAQEYKNIKIPKTTHKKLFEIKLKSDARSIGDIIDIMIKNAKKIK